MRWVEDMDCDWDDVSEDCNHEGCKNRDECMEAAAKSLKKILAELYKPYGDMDVVKDQLGSLCDDLNVEFDWDQKLYIKHAMPTDYFSQMVDYTREQTRIILSNLN